MVKPIIDFAKIAFQMGKKPTDTTSALGKKAFQSLYGQDICRAPADRKSVV